MIKRILCLLLFGLLVSVARPDELEFVVKPYIQNVSTDGITILWETSIPSKGQVKYGQASHGNSSAPLENLKQSESVDKMHNVRLSSLEAESNYFYQVIINAGLDTIHHKVNPFMTAVESNRPITFAVFGDTQ